MDYNERIENRQFKTVIHQQIAKIEAERSASKSKEAEETLKGEILKERLSIITKKARDAFNEKSNELKQRRGIKRAYFKDALELNRLCVEGTPPWLAVSNHAAGKTR